MTHDICFQKTVTFENGDDSNRGGRDCVLVWVHTFSSSSKRPCDTYLGWFKTSEHFYMCHVSYRKCAKIHVSDTVKVHSGSWYHMQCTDVMGVIVEQCVIIVICSVKLRVQALHAFHIEGWECVEAQDRQFITMWHANAVFVSKSYQRISVTGVQ